jgi:hypothetical protein
MAVMISIKPVLYCLALGGAYLLVLSLLLEFADRKMKLTAGIPSEMLETSGPGWWFMNYLMEALFYVAIPTLVYSFLYFIIPLSGVKAGIAAALLAFTLGAAPALMGLSVKVKLPMPYLLFVLLSLLLKLAGALTIIAYLYSV